RDGLSVALLEWQQRLSPAADWQQSGNRPAPALPSLQPVGSPITSETLFLEKYLGPALARWAPFARSRVVPFLHAAVLACRWTMIPDPGWARAYFEALGGTARLTILTVEATWLRFADAWPGELEAAWQCAVSEPTVVHLICLRDLNRALPQCWARPLLDIL